MKTGYLHGVAGALVLAMVLVGALPASAQIQAGQVFGRAADGTGAVLPGVVVTLESPALITPQSVVTGPSGAYRFPSVPIGTYTVRFELPGFKTFVRQGVQITVGFSAEINARLEISTVEETITVSGESPVVDTTAVKTGETFNKQMLESLPSARDPWVILEQTPGVVMDRQNVGGSASGQQSGFTVNGGNDGNTMWNVDGVTTTDMAATGASANYYDFDSFEEIQIQTGGNDASLQTGGINLNMITKSGSNVFRGSGRFFVVDSKFQADNVTEALKADGADSGNPIKNIKDYGFEVGGPMMRNKAWFWGGYGKQNISVGILGFTVPGGDPNNPADLAPDATILDNYNAKLQYQPVVAHKFTFLYTYADKVRNARGASPTTAIESTWRQSGPTDLWKGSWQWIASDRMTIEAQGSYVGGGFVLDFHEPELENVQPLLDLDTGKLSRSNRRAGPFVRPQGQFKVDMNYFASSWLGGDHQMKWGVGWRSTPFDSFGTRGGGVTARVDAGVPDSADFYRNSVSKREMYNVSAYINDSYNRGRMRLNVGVRVDYQDDKAAAATVPANALIPDILPSLDFPGADSGVTFIDFSPRFGFTYDARGNGKTVAKASASIYYGQGIFTGGTLNPVGESRVRYAWNDANGDQFVQTNEINFSRILSRSNYNIDDPTAVTSPNSVDQNLQNDRTREVIVGLDHELRPNFGVGFSYIYRKYDHFQWTPTNGLSSSDYVPATITRSCTATLGCDQDSYTVTYYQLPFTEPSGETLTNQNYWKNFNGVEITARKRYSDRWMLNGSVALGSTPAYWGEGGYQDPTNIEFQNGAQENTLNAQWIFKLSGLYSFPWGINGSAFFNARQGFPFFRDIRSPTRTGGIGQINVKYEKDGESRYPNFYTLDMRVEKAFTVGPTRITASMDVFNLGNANTVLEREGTQNASNGNRVFTILAPRVARFGVRVTF